MPASIDKISRFLSLGAASAKSIIKMALQSRRVETPATPHPDTPLIIMGNGPSLATTIEERLTALQQYPTMAVNFAANTPQFFELRPRYYILADPHFFNGGDENVRQLWERFQDDVRWHMTLFVPARQRHNVKTDNPHITVATFNPVGVEGYTWLRHMAYGTGRGMPRPRNVLIPAIMTGMAMGFRNIYIAGADHSWTRTLSVNDDNEVVSIQPHFYTDNAAETSRVTAVYRDVRLHQIINSFYVAFKAYHDIADYARRHHVNIYNSTPGSFIDAFPRRPLPQYTMHN